MTCTLLKLVRERSGWEYSSTLIWELDFPWLSRFVAGMKFKLSERMNTEIKWNMVLWRRLLLFMECLLVRQEVNTLRIVIIDLNPTHNHTLYTAKYWLPAGPIDTPYCSLSMVLLTCNPALLCALIYRNITHHFFLKLEHPEDESLTTDSPGIIILHPGSSTLRLSLSNQLDPFYIPHLIAYCSENSSAQDLVPNCVKVLKPSVNISVCLFAL